MRKQILMLSMAVASVSFAQTPAVQSKVSTARDFNLGNETLDASMLAKSAQINSNWYSYVNAYNSFYGQNNSELNANMLFPDSTILVNYGTSYGGPWIHNVGTLMDLNAPAFRNSQDPTQDFVKTVDYTIDSLSTTVVYNRVLGSNIVDTLVFNIVDASASNLSSRSYFYNSQGTPGHPADVLNPGDTVFIINFDWDHASLSTPGSVKEIRVLMDDSFANDTTANGLNQVDVEVNQMIAAKTGNLAWYSGIIGVTMEFRPGYTWAANTDTLGVNVNSCRFLSWELNGADTDPYYSKDDFNVSCLVPQDVRYDQAGGWNSTLIPSYAYMGSSPGYAYEAHEMNLKITQDVNISIEENTGIEFNVFPNPSNGNVKVKFGAVDNGVYNVRLVNIIGQEVFNQDVEVSAGQVEAFNFESLNKGVYLLNISGKGKSTVQKITLR